MRRLILSLLALSFLLIACASKQNGKEPVLIEKYFENRDTYVIVCSGKGKEDLPAPARRESAKRTALLNAYYFIKKDFGDFVKPDREGEIKKMVTKGDYVIITYVVKKRNLKRYYKK